MKKKIFFSVFILAVGANMFIYEQDCKQGKISVSLTKEALAQASQPVTAEVHVALPDTKAGDIIDNLFNKDYQENSYRCCDATGVVVGEGTSCDPGDNEICTSRSCTAGSPCEI